MSVLPVCLFIFLNHISTSANASRHNSQRRAKLNLILPALMSLISLERERPQVNKSVLLSGVVWSGSSPARYEAWASRHKLQWPQLISDWSQAPALLTQQGFSSTAYTCPRTINKPELRFRLSWDQLPLLTVLLDIFSYTCVTKQDSPLNERITSDRTALYFQIEGKPD